METPTMLELMSRYKGKRVSDIFLSSYCDIGNKQEAKLRATSLIENVQLIHMDDDCKKFLIDEIVPRLWSLTFWKCDAEEYPYMFYRNFILDNRVRQVSIPNDEEMYIVFKCITSGVVLWMYDDKKLYRFIRKNSSRSSLSLFRRK